MEKENYINLSDIIFLNLYLGIVVYLIGIIINVAILKILKARHKIYFLCIQFITSYLISIFIFIYWIFPIDYMCIFIYLPALFALFITLVIEYAIIKIHHNRKKHFLK